MSRCVTDTARCGTGFAAFVMLLARCALCTLESAAGSSGSCTPSVALSVTVTFGHSPQLPAPRVRALSPFPASPVTARPHHAHAGPRSGTSRTPRPPAPPRSAPPRPGGASGPRAARVSNRPCHTARTFPITLAPPASRTARSNSDHRPGDHLFPASQPTSASFIAPTSAGSPLMWNASQWRPLRRTSRSSARLGMTAPRFPFCPLVGLLGDRRQQQRDQCDHREDEHHLAVRPGEERLDTSTGQVRGGGEEDRHGGFPFTWRDPGPFALVTRTCGG